MLREFVRESNRIEGIVRDPEPYEIEAHQRLLACDFLTLKSVEAFVFDICGRRLRREPGMDVRVGPHVPPSGGPEIASALALLVERSGRAIWNWQMQRERHDPYGLPFLHRFYYQALDASEVRA